jgi:hypothetical protein
MGSASARHGRRTLGDALPTDDRGSFGWILTRGHVLSRIVFCMTRNTAPVSDRRTTEPLTTKPRNLISKSPLGLSTKVQTARQTRTNSKTHVGHSCRPAWLVKRRRVAHSLQLFSTTLTSYLFSLTTLNLFARYLLPRRWPDNFGCSSDTTHFLETRYHPTHRW